MGSLQYMQLFFLVLDYLIAARYSFRISVVYFV